MATSISFDIFARDHASSSFLKVAAAAEVAKSSFGDAGTAALGLTKLIGGAGLIPVAAGASAALAELGTSAAAGGLALGVFGLSAGGILAGMLKAQEGIRATSLALSKLTPGTKDYRTEAKKLNLEQEGFNKSFGPAAKGYNDMTNSFAKFKTATSHVTLGVLHKGFELIAKVLPKLVPVSNAAGKAVGGLLHDLTNWTKSPSFKSVLHWLETSGPKAIKAFGHSVGNIIGGLGGIFSNFVGPGDKAAHTLETLTKRFDQWGNSKGVSDSVDKFLKYVHDNGGKIASVFQSLGQILPKLVGALGGLGSVNLTGIGLFLNLVAGLPQGVFNVLAKGIFAVVAATKIWSIVTKIQEAAMAALDVVMDANPITLVILAVAALAVGMVIAYKKSETFRKIVQGAFHGVQAAASAVAGFFTHQVPAAFHKVVDTAASVLGWVRSHWPLLLAILTGPFGLAVYAIAKNWDKIKAGTSAAVDFVKGKFGGFVDYIQSIPGRLGDMAAKFLTAGKTLGGKILSGMVDGMKSVSGFMGGLITAVKDAINSALNLPLDVNFDKGPFHLHATVIPALAQGGIVTRATTALIGEAGPEAVVPLSGRNARNLGLGGDTHYHITINGALDPIAVGKQVEKALARVKNAGGGRALAFQ